MQRAPLVIVTRPEPDASRFAEELRAAGFAPLLSPAMEVVWRDAALDLAGVGALAFTSANGVRAFRKVSCATTLPAFAVGEITAAEARAAGFKTVIAAAGDVASLVERIAAARGDVPGAVLHISGADQTGDLAALLSARGMEARRAVLYAARPLAALSTNAAAALTARPFADWVALFSPRSAEVFLEQARSAGADLSHSRAACLSAAVAKIAERARWAGVDRAEDRSSAAIIRLMAGRRRP